MFYVRIFCKTVFVKLNLTFQGKFAILNKQCDSLGSYINKQSTRPIKLNYVPAEASLGQNDINSQSRC